MKHITKYPHLASLYSLLFVVGFLGACTVQPGTGNKEHQPSSKSETWRSSLYPEEWDPDALGLFESDHLIQDFSYAGYHSGEKPLPHPEKGLIDVTRSPYNADSTGKKDATAAIQLAIDQAAENGGGVVKLPAGTFLLSVPENAREAIRIHHDGIILRGAGVGETRLLNTTTDMRERVVIRFATRDARGDFFNRPSAETAIREDLLRPTKRIPVASTREFDAGDFVTLRHEMTDAWINEHGASSWMTDSGRPRSPVYLREITAIDRNAGTLTIDIPLRYFLKTRDNPRVYRLTAPPMREVGIEALSIGNQEHPSRQWAEDDHGKSGTGAYDAHRSYFISFERVRDAWARDIESFSPQGNRSGAHLLSGGILLSQVSRVTLADVSLEKVQYGGAGGNGYLYRLQHANDSLLINCRAGFSRHGFVFSHAGSNGNVLHRCIDAFTGRATGHTGEYKTDGKGSDHHMHFSHSNLIDQCVAVDSWFEARYRPYPSGATVLHGITAAHTVFWNVKGRGDSPQPVVISEQGRYGYIIGTSGKRSKVELPNNGGDATRPPDHVEGKGQGKTLRPASLYQDQLIRRLL